MTPTSMRQVFPTTGMRRLELLAWGAPRIPDEAWEKEGEDASIAWCNLLHGFLET